VTGTEGRTVGAMVTGGSVAVGDGEGLDCASVGVGVRGGAVTDGEAEDDALGDAEGDGLGDGAAVCCDEITAAPSSRSATSAMAAKTVKTVDQRSAGGREAGAAPSGGSPAGRCSWTVSSGSAGGDVLATTA
jgi:hypothetical protein